MTSKQLKLLPNQDGSYDLIIQYDRMDTDFALDFLSWERINKRTESVADFPKKNARNLKISVEVATSS